MSKPDISIVIVNWKVRRLLEKCLDSIYRYRGDLDLQIFVVDNDSRDNTSEMMMVQYPEINTISLSRNIGFAAANNLAINRCTADYIFLLNPDTEISANYLQEALKYLKAHPQVGILGTKILNPDKSIQSSVRRFPDLVSQILVMFKMRNVLLNNDRIKHYLFSEFDYNKEQEVPQVMGAAMFITRPLLEKIGALDSKFFIWFEEIDFCMRAKKAGFKVMYLPSISLIHYGGVSFGQRNGLRKQWLFDRSLLYYFRKHGNILQWLALALMVPINLALTLLYVTFIKKREF